MSYAGHCWEGYSSTQPCGRPTISWSILLLLVLADPAREDSRWTVFFNPCVSAAGWVHLWSSLLPPGPPLCPHLPPNSQILQVLHVLMRGMRPPSWNLLFPAGKSSPLTSKRPWKTPLRVISYNLNKSRSQFCWSSHYVCNNCAFSIMTVCCFCN